LDALLKSGASEAEIYTRIEEYKEKFADYGRDRRSAIEFHLRNIERLLMPTQTTSVVLATLQMGSAAAASSSSSSSSASTPVAPISASSETATMEVGSSALTEQQVSTSTMTEPLSSSTIVPDRATTISSTALSKLDAKSLFRHLVEILQVTPEQNAALKDSRFVAQEMDECLKASLGVLKELQLRLTQCGEDLENEFNNVRSILTPTQAAKFLVWVANNKACIHMLNELWNRVYPQQEAGEQPQSTTPTDEDFVASADPSP
jgi:hypothetical protein